MDWTEKDIEEAIEENPSEIGCSYIVARQVETAYGIIDMLGVRTDDDDSQPVALLVIELKKGGIDCNAVGQLQRYIWDLNAGKKLLAKEPNTALRWLDLPFVGVLVGSSINNDAQYLCHACRFEAYEYSASISMNCREVWSQSWGPDFKWDGWQKAKSALAKALQDVDENTPPSDEEVESPAAPSDEVGEKTA